jgi:hypothetical protein
MPEEDDRQPRDPWPSEQSQPPSEFPRASEVLARPSLAIDPLNDFDPDHKRRYHEAAVQKLEIEAKQADDDREMRKEIAERVFKAISVQVVIADIAFLTYGFWSGWEIPGSTMSAWLAAVVLQVIAVGMVIARSLFPHPLPNR